MLFRDILNIVKRFFSDFGRSSSSTTGRKRSRTAERKRLRTVDDGQALPLAVIAITMIVIFITGEALVLTSIYSEIRRNRADDLLHNVNDWAIHTVNNLAATEHDLKAVLWYDTTNSKPSKYRQWRTLDDNKECVTVTTNLHTKTEQAIAKEPACWKVAQFEITTGTTKGGIATDTVIITIETRSECAVGYDDLNIIPNQCGAADYLVLRYARRTFLHYILHYDNDNLPSGPATDETVVAFHDVDDITGAIHTNLTSVLVCGGAATFQDAIVETGGNSGSGNYANQCSSKTAPPISKQPINTGQLNVASFGTPAACDSGQATGVEGLTPGRQWLRDAVRVVQGGVSGWVESSDGKVDINDLINEDGSLLNAYYINDEIKVVYSPGDILVQNTGSDKLTRPVTIIAGRDIILEGGDGPIGTTAATPPNVLALIAGCNLRIQYKRNPNMPTTTPGTQTTIPEPTNNQQGWCLTQLPDSITPNPDLIIKPRSIPVTEGSTATYTVKLTTRPSNSVTVNISLSDTVDPNIDIVITPTSLTFTEQNWDTEQTITVTTSTDTDKNDNIATLEHTTNTAYTTDTDLVHIILYDGDNISTPANISVGTAGNNDSTNATNTLVHTASSRDYQNIKGTGKGKGTGTISSLSRPPINGLGVPTITGLGVPTISGLRVPTITGLSKPAISEHSNNVFGDILASPLTILGSSLIPNNPVAEVLAAELCDYMDITLDNVAILAPAGGIWVEEWSTPIRCDDQTPPTCHTPTITINGSMAVHNRGLFGQYDAQTGKLTTGYQKSFRYPASMQHGTTAWWPDLEQGEWISISSSGLIADLAISPASVIVAENSTDYYTVKLATEPIGDVTVTISSKIGSDPNISIDTDTVTTGNQNTLTFTSANWNTAQTVAIAATSDFDNLDGKAEFVHTATSTDPNSEYATLTATLTVIEDDRSLPSLQPPPSPP